MRPVYEEHPLTDDDIRGLVAFLDSNPPTPTDRAPQMLFFLVGLGASLIGLIAMAFVWRNRLRAVRAPMVEAGE